MVSAVDHEWLVGLVSNFADRFSILLSICNISVKVIGFSLKMQLPVSHQQAFLINISYTIGRIGTKIGVKVNIDEG